MQYKIICQVNLENLVFNRSEQISLLNDFSEIRVSSTAFLCDDDDDDDSFYSRCFKKPHNEF